MSSNIDKCRNYVYTPYKSTPYICMFYSTPKHNLTFLLSLFYFSRSWKSHLNSGSDRAKTTGAPAGLRPPVHSPTIELVYSQFKYLNSDRIFSLNQRDRIKHFKTRLSLTTELFNISS